MTGLEAFKVMEEALKSLEQVTRRSAVALPGAAATLTIKAETYAEAALIAQNFRQIEERVKP